MSEWKTTTKIIHFGKLSSYYRTRRVPKKGYKDTLKKAFTSCEIGLQQWTAQHWWLSPKPSLSSQNCWRIQSERKKAVLSWITVLQWIQEFLRPFPEATAHFPSASSVSSVPAPIEEHPHESSFTKPKPYIYLYLGRGSLLNGYHCRK